MNLRNVFSPGLAASFVCWCGLKRSQPLTNSANGHVYILLDQSTWKKSEAEAVSLGGHLATIRNQAEEDWAFKTFGDYKGGKRLLWIGLSDTEKKFHFGWSSGESVSYTAWGQGEPNNVGTGEDFVAIFYPGHHQANQWNDWNDREKDPIGLHMNGVVEIIPVKILLPDIAKTSREAFPVEEAVEINPSLTITNDSRSIHLQWPISSVHYVLEATTNLAQPFTLFGYTESANLESKTMSVTITNPCLETCPRMFFRLRKP